MPTSLFHLNISKKIAEKYPKYDTPNFYIGTIAPDAINLNGFAEKSLRWSAHKRAKDLEEWKNNIINFYNQELENYPEDYLMGYVIHVVTDIIADQIYYKDGIYEDIIKNRTSEDEAFKFFKDQIEIYENSQLNESWWSDVKSKLENCEAYDINSLPKQDILDWKNQVIGWYEERTFNNYDYITPDILNMCVEKILEVCHWGRGHLTFRFFLG